MRNQENAVAQTSYFRLFLTILTFLNIALVPGRVSAQQRGVSAMEIATTIVIHDDGSSSVEIQSRQQVVTITATGQRLTMPRCAAETNPTPREWHLRASSRNTGTECIITLATSHNTLQTLRDQIRGFGGDLVARGDRFTLTLFRNDRLPQTALLRYKMTYKYLITAPYLDSFSNGARQGNSQVAFTTTNPSHSIEILGRIEKGRTEEPRVKPTPDPPTPYTTQEKRPYLGCWSARNGDVLFVAATTLQTAKSDKALEYREVSRDTASNLYFLQLLELDRSKEFQPFVSMRIVGRELRTNNYLSREDFLHGKSVGNESWLKADCADVLPRLQPPAKATANPPLTQKSGQESKTKKALKGIWGRVKKPN
jgi:hypothetical protein